MLKRALSPRGEIVIPATALAQAWRGGPRSARMVRFLQKSQIDALDERRAKEVGTRLGARDKTDIADGHVVSCAVERQAVVLTSDLADMKALANPGERLRLIAI